MARLKEKRSTDSPWILLVDDNSEYLNATRRVLEAEGYQVLTAVDGAEAIAQVGRQVPDLVLLDFYMPKMNGDEVVQALRSREPRLQIIFQTGYAGETPPLAMLRSLGIQGYFDKSEGVEKLLLWTEVGIRSARAQKLLLQSYAEQELKVQERTALLQETLTKLAEAEKVAQLGHLVVGISHQVNTPLGNAVLLASHLGDLLETLEEAHQAQGLTRKGLEEFLRTSGEIRSGLDKNLATCRNLINRFKQIGMGSEDGPVPVSVSRLAGDSLFLARLGRPNQGARLELDCPAGYTVQVKKLPLGQVFEELMGNSIDYAGVPGRELVISIRIIPDSRGFTIVYDDDGPGVSERILPSLFTPFFTTALGPNHAGLGLYTVYLLVTNRLQGTIAAHRRPSGSLGFTLTVPASG